MYRKFKADGIFTGTELINGDHVLVTDDKGRIEDIIPYNDADAGVEVLKGILCPGFINCHCHIELSYLKDIIPQHTGLVQFVQAVMRSRNAATEIKMQAMKSAAKELYDSGTVAIGDICNTADSIPLKLNSPVFWNNFIEVSGFVDGSAEKRLAEAENVARQFASLDYPCSIVPHAPYSVSKTLFKLINEYSSGELISIHNQEEISENELYKSKTGNFLQLYEELGIDISSFSPTGKTSFQSWLPYFTKGQRIISVHNTFISQEDIDIAPDVFYCTCIKANLYIENCLPPLDLLLNNNCKMVIGTDSYASNTCLNMLEEMKTIQKNFPSVSTETLLQWATINGANALNLLPVYGSFEKGKTPGILLLQNIENGIFGPETSSYRLI